MRKLYRFYLDCYRHGCVEGVFSALEGDVLDAIGKRACFGEILGKHSDVNVCLTSDDFQVVTDDQEFIAKFDEYKLETGYNPLSYLEEDL